MGFFDSKSTTRTQTTNQNAGFSEVAGSAVSLNITGGGKKSSTPTTVNLLDGGAISGAFDFATRAQSEAGRQVEIAGANSAAIVREAVGVVAESGRAETENLAREAMRWGTFALLGWAAFQAFGKWKG